MIETIFYFANSKAEYDSNANSGNISARTISFVPTGNGVGDIYKNGIKYGSSIDEDELIRIINEKVADIDFNIPFASTTKAGIIKLGKGLKAVGNDGTVNVDFTGLNGIDGLDGLVENILKTIIGKNGTGVVVTPRSLSGSTVAIADIKVGDTTKTIYAPVDSNNQNDPTNTGKTEVSVVPLFNSSTGTTKIATITVDGNTKELWIPAGTGGGDNPGGGYNGPTDEEIDEKINQAKQDLQEEIDAAKNIANAEKDRLNELINTLDSEIQTKFEAMLDDVDWMQENWPDGSGSTSNFGQQDVEDYLLMIGVWDENEDHTKSNAKWSKIAQKVDTIELAVNALSSDGNITEALQSSINLAVQDGVASLNLETMYAKKDDTEKIVEWLASGFRSATSSEMTYNEIVSAARNGNHSAISNLYSKVEEIDGSYVSRAAVETMVGDSISGLVSEADLEHAESQLYSAIGENADNIAAVRTYVDDKTSKASIVSAVGDVSGGLVTKATYDSDMTELQSKYDGMQGLVYTYVDKKVSEAGLVASSDLEGYVKKASVIASINDSGESNVKIDADKINVGGICIEDLNISGINSLTSNEIWTNAIKSSVGDITISADNIILDGTTFVEDLFANLMAVAKKVSVGEGDGAIRIYDTGLGYAGLVCGNTSSEYISIDSSTGGWNMVLYDTSEAAKLSRNGLYFYSGSGGTSSSNTTLCINAETPEIRLYDGTLSSYSNQMIISPTGTSTSSDMRLKDVIADKLLTAEQIADAPIFTYTPKANPNANPIIGTSAQYWQDITPEAVSELDGYLALDYSKVATTSVINLAKEVVTLKEENTTLKQRVEALEARLQLIENKLNAQ